jgi:hypothetical protein
MSITKNQEFCKFAFVLDETGTNFPFSHPPFPVPLLQSHSP